MHNCELICAEIKFVLQFCLQVVTGGQYDVDVMLTDPQNQELYKVVKEQYGSFQFKPKMTGIYKVMNFLLSM